MEQQPDMLITLPSVADDALVDAALADAEGD
jgi:hypothetical protein